MENYSSFSKLVKILPLKFLLKINKPEVPVTFSIALHQLSGIRINLFLAGYICISGYGKLT